MHVSKIKVPKFLAGNYRQIFFEIAFFILSGIVVFASLSLLIRQAGWPANHDLLSVKYRVEIYAEHFRHGDLFPIWSSSDAFGLGTPLPLYYQKLFYYLAGLLLLISGAIKLSIIVALAVCMFVGVYGMSLVTRKLTADKLLRLIAPQTLLLANYTFTNWLVRGDVAELAAMMLIPWVIYWCVLLLQTKRASWLIVPIGVLLVDAHNAIAMVSLITLAIAYGIYAYQVGLSGIIRTLPKFAVMVIVSSILLLPMLGMEIAFGHDFDPASKIIQNHLSPPYTFLPAWRYFIDRNYVWLKSPRGLTVQIDYGIWLGLVVTCIGLILASAFLWSKKRFGNLLRKADWSVGLFLALAILVNGALLFKFSAPVYAVIHPLNLLQFPWRLLALITPLGIAAVIWTFALFFKGQKYLAVGRLIAVVWLASFVFLSPLNYQFQYEFLDKKGFDNPTQAGIYGTKTILGIGEYLPKTYTASGTEINEANMDWLYNHYYYTNQEANAGRYCIITRVPIASFEVLSENFQISCERSSRIFLPVTYSRFMRVGQIYGQRFSRYPFDRIYTDPRLTIIAPPGKTDIQVNFPTWQYVLPRIV